MASPEAEAVFEAMRQHIIPIELTEDELAYITKAANIKGMTLDEFVIYALKQMIKYGFQ